MTTHTGTHLDVPRHLVADGLTVSDVPLEWLMGRALVVELFGVREIGRHELKKLPLHGEERILLKTGNSRFWGNAEFSPDYAYLTEEGAKYLVEIGVQLVGTEYLSIEKYPVSGTVHSLLLENDVLILEGLDLDAVAPGHYELICLPLKIAGGDGAPARVILRGTGSGEGGSDFHTTRWPLA
jgi:arylformamidase